MNFDFLGFVYLTYQQCLLATSHQCCRWLPKSGENEGTNTNRLSISFSVLFNKSLKACVCEGGGTATHPSPCTRIYGPGNDYNVLICTHTIYISSKYLIGKFIRKITSVKSESTFLTFLSFYQLLT